MSNKEADETMLMPFPDFSFEKPATPKKLVIGSDGKEMVNILFKVSDKSNVLIAGKMTMKELYGTGKDVWVTDMNGVDRCISRRDFHIVDGGHVLPVGLLRNGKRRAIVCDIDGVLNFIGKKVGDTDHRELLKMVDGSTVQWTHIDKSLDAQKNFMIFDLLTSQRDAGFDILFLTARGDTQRVVTHRFLRDGMANDDFMLFMRGFSANDISAPDLKAQMLQACILPYYEVQLFIDDDAKNINAIKAVCPEVPVMHYIS